MAFSLTQTHKNNGFTLIELLIVVTIMGIIVALTAFSITEMIRRGRVARAQGDLNTIAKAIRQMELDTSRHPGPIALTPCIIATSPMNVVADPDAVGLLSAAAGFSNWKGPYLEEIPGDPWGQEYYFDANYSCLAETKGCEEVGDDDVRALYSGGENRSAMDVSDADNIVLVLCH